MITLAMLAAALAAVPPWTSFNKLPSANGVGVLVFNAGSPSGPVLDRFSDHVYQQYSFSSEPVRDLLYDTYFGLRVGGEGGWLTTTSSFAMETGTNLIQVQRPADGLIVTELAFVPMDLAAPVFVHLLRVENAGDAPVEDVHAFALINHHVGDRTHEGEALTAQADGRFTEWGERTGLRFDVLPLAPPDALGCSPDNPWVAVNEGRDLGGCGEARGDDLVMGYQWSLGALAPGEVRWVGKLHSFGFGVEADLATPALAWLDGRDPEALVAAERDTWAAWQARGAPPAGLSADEEAVYRQALAFLKMTQVREPGDAYGQLTASMPVATDGLFGHLWNIAWVRDGAYAIVALAAAGHVEEAEAALAFMVQEGKTGAWRAYVNDQDHALSICRMYGDGSEWTDDDGTGPNIEFDNFGLYLWAFGTTLRAAGDDALLLEHREAVLDRTADVLLGLIDPETGLIVPDSSIWERHWNGNQKRFTYTSAWAARGLDEAAWMAQRLGEPARARAYAEAAEGLRAAVAAWLVREDGVLVGNLEEHQRGEPALDLAAVDAFNNGTLDPGSPSFAASMAAWESLRVASGNGFARNDDGDLYDLQEWVMIDLRLAEALQRAGREDEAAALDDWITALALANHLVIPELLTAADAAYAGPAPMMGFGAGLYVWRMHVREDLDLLGLPARAPDSGDTGADPAPDKDCGCAGTPGGAGGALALLMLWRRRRVR